MRLSGVLFILMAFAVPRIGYCQLALQKPLQAMTSPKTGAPVVGIPQKDLRILVEKARVQDKKLQIEQLRYGGGDSGGGTAVIVDDVLRLRDLAFCPVNGRVTKSLRLNPEIITPTISRIAGVSVRSTLQSQVAVSDKLLESLLWMSAARSNWYVIDVDLKLAEDADDSKLAIFKRPLGILINKKLFKQLSTVDRLGLLVHESLRMASLGFGVTLQTSEIEDITCRLISGQKVESDDYSGLREYLNRAMEQFSADRVKAEEILVRRFESMANLDDKMSFFSLPARLTTYLYQPEISKFEVFRKNVPNQSYAEIEEAFYTWAGLEAPAICYGEKDCHYHEKWPDEFGKNSALQTWKLIYNDVAALGWSETATGFSLVFGKDAIKVHDLDKFCGSVSAKTGDHYEAITEQDLRLLGAHRGAFMVLNRSDVSAVDLGDTPLLARRGNQSMLWSPDTEVSGYMVVTVFIPDYGRPACIRR